MSRAARLAAASLAFLLGGVALAVCEAEGNRTRLEIAGVGVGWFDAFRTDRATGTITLSGDVCVEDARGGWTLRTDRLEVVGADGSPQLVSADARLELEGWSLEAATMTADAATVDLVGVHVFGADLVGSADEATYALATGHARLVRLRVQGPTYRAWASDGEVVNGRIALRDARVTTCACDGVPAYLIEAPEASMALDSGAFTLVDARLRAVGLDVPLGAQVTLGEAFVEDLRSRVVVGEQSRARGELGQGFTVVLPRLYEHEGVRAGFGVTGLIAGARPVASLRAEARGVDPATPAPRDPAPLDASVTFELPADGIVLDADVTRDLGAGFGVGVAFRNRAVPQQHFLHEGVIAATYETRLPLGVEDLRGSLASRAFAAVSAQTVAGTPVAGSRLGASVDLTLSAPETGLGRFGLAVGLAATAYPDQGAHQAVAAVSPSWRLQAGPATFSVAHAWRGVHGGSPFASTLDRASPEHHLTASATVRGAVGPATARLSVRAAYDILQAAREGGAAHGADDLELSAALDLPARGGTFSARVSSDVAGLITEHASDAPFVEGALGYAEDRFEVGARLRYDLRTSTVRALDLSGRVRIDAEHVSLTPLLAVDVAPLLAAGAPALAGHGLEVEWRTCCATLVLGYEQMRDDFRTTFALRVDPRPLPERLGADAW